MEPAPPGEGRAPEKAPLKKEITNMKKLIACAGLVAAVAFTPMSYAEAEAESSGSTPAVQEAMKGVKSFNRKINKKAKYYIYLQSASWCGPCNQ